MLINKALQSASGYLVIRVEGRFLERFLNVCSRRNIYLWDIRRLSDTSMTCKISIRGFRLLPIIARKTHCTAKIIDKRGLPIVIRRYKKRRWFLVGLGIFLLLMLSLNLYVWKIEVTGNDTVPTDIILAELEECGVKVGQFRFRLDEKALKNQMVAKIPQLSWLWINKQGSKVLVQVRERKLPPAIVDKTQICNLIATKDGVIHTMNVREGKNVVAVGDSVRAGDILTTGIIDIEEVGRRTVHADGEILARTWYENSRAYSLTKREQIPTGNSKTRWGISFFGHRLNFGREEPFTQYQTTETSTDWCIGSTYLGVTIHKQVFQEVQTVESPLTPDEVQAAGGEELKKEIRLSAGLDAKAVKEDVTLQQIDEDTFEVTVIAEYLENIARQVPVTQEQLDAPAPTPSAPPGE